MLYRPDRTRILAGLDLIRYYYQVELDEAWALSLTDIKPIALQIFGCHAEFEFDDDDNRAGILLVRVLF